MWTRQTRPSNALKSARDSLRGEPWDKCLATFEKLFSRSEQQPVSFAFGPLVGWEALTVYVATAGGAIYSICPVLPKQRWARAVNHPDRRPTPA